MTLLLLVGTWHINSPSPSPSLSSARNLLLLHEPKGPPLKVGDSQVRVLLDGLVKILTQKHIFIFGQLVTVHQHSPSNYTETQLSAYTLYGIVIDSL